MKPWLLEVNASPSLSTNTQDDTNLKMHMLHGLLDIIDMTGNLSGVEEHVSGWDLIYDNGYIEIDPEQCGYTTFLGSAVQPSMYELHRHDTKSAGRNTTDATSGGLNLRDFMSTAELQALKNDITKDMNKELGRLRMS